ncbi:MAG: DUF3332 family protein [Kiritimatiellae bacterium]|jgi:hypothetical protein|nr:DUF3332 family protein [Kiritimatiellia bacterium]
MKKAMFLTLAALTLAAASTGCVGKFRLFNAVSKWNQTANEEKWINELIFLGLNIIPVYGLSYFADVLVFNSIEFWTGKPVDFLAGVDQQGNEYRIVSNGDGTSTLLYKGQACTLTKQGDSLVATKDGAYIGTFSKQGSLVTFTAPDGSVQAALR